MKITCEIQHVDLQSDQGRDVEGVVATCSRCGHSEESFGTSEASIRRCLVLLRESCPRRERNYYVSEGETLG